jgi:hypothetical protein
MNKETIAEKNSYYFQGNVAEQELYRKAAPLVADPTRTVFSMGRFCFEDNC